MIKEQQKRKPKPSAQDVLEALVAEARARYEGYMERQPSLSNEDRWPSYLNGTLKASFVRLYGQGKKAFDLYYSPSIQADR